MGMPSRKRVVSPIEEVVVISDAQVRYYDILIEIGPPTKLIDVY